MSFTNFCTTIKLLLAAGVSAKHITAIHLEILWNVWGEREEREGGEGGEERRRGGEGKGREGEGERVRGGREGRRG